MMTEHQSVFFPTENDIYDALFSNAQKVTVGYLLDRLRARGIFLSPEEDRESIVSYVSVLEHDYHQFKELSAHVARSSRTDKATNSIVEGEVSASELNVAFNALKAVRGAQSETMNLVAVDSNTTRIYLTYEEVDHSKTRMIQKVSGEGYIDVIKVGESTKVRHSANQRVEQIAAALVQQIGVTKKAELKTKKVDFSGIADTSLRTKFFTRLIVEILGYPMINVSRIQLGRKDADQPDTQQEREDLEDELTGDIKRASFDGSGLLNSQVYQQLEQRGYFLSSIRWLCEESTKNPRRFELEALFENPDRCSGFRYHVRGVYRPKKENEYTGIRPTKDDEESLMLGRIEAAANKIFAELTAPPKEVVE